MLVLSRRPHIREALCRRLEHRWGRGHTRPLHVSETVSAFQQLIAREGTQAITRHHLVVYDMDICRQCTEPDVLIERWHRTYPYLQPVLLIGQPAGAHLTLANDISRRVPACILLSVEDLHNEATWDKIYQHSLSYRAGPSILADLVATAGREFPAHSYVVEALRLAPEVAQAGEFCRRLHRDRTLVTKVCTGAGQMGPKELLVLSRLLYDRRLRHAHWSDRAIAVFLGCTNYTPLRRYLERGFAGAWARVERLTYPQLVPAAASVLLGGVSLVPMTQRRRVLPAVFADVLLEEVA